jgi:hypothetical protein
MNTVHAIRYVTPLREGGSLPAVVEADDGELYVVKFLGAGQGPRALIAELVVGELARACGLRVPEIVLVELDPAFGRNEPDPEIRDLLRASTGTNLGLAYLPGAIAYDPIAPPEVDEALASAIVWLDALTLNVDRSPRNPNLLLWEDGLWLIDHGAALYFHHAWSGARAHATGGYPQSRDHVLLHRAARLPDAGATLAPRVDAALHAGLLEDIPEAWLAPGGDAALAQQLRHDYNDWLLLRLGAAATWIPELVNARSTHV